MLKRIEVFNKDISPMNVKDASHIETFLNSKLVQSNEGRAYTLDSAEGIENSRLSEVFSNFHSQNVFSENFPLEENTYFVDIKYLPGVKDNSGEACQMALGLFGKKASVSSHRVYQLRFSKSIEKEKLVKAIEDTLANTLIEKVHIYSQKENRFEELKSSKVLLDNSLEVKEFNLEVEDEELIKISEENCLALTLEEMKTIQSFYRDEKIKASRKSAGLSTNPTDVEVEVLAQTWSEHCKHKIFNSIIDYTEGDHDGFKLGDLKVQSLFKEYIKAVTDKNQKDWLESVFVDNSGIISLDDELCVCMKVETHNSPSALDPYGGAITGILGVNRDILGTGLGARPVANTDIFCFAPPDFPNVSEKKYFPKNLLSPQRILNGVHKGVIDGGNKSGIPTINGALYFDVNYAGKPLVYVGTLGIMPKKLKSGRSAVSADPQVGDLIVMVGGDIGADGIHGATFSSLELDESSPASAVQIGDPFTQKKVMDFILEARDAELISAITDNGAGGLSSSIGEMAEFTNGASLDLAKAPTKYPGLRPFELMISESQERMSVAVKQEHIEEFLRLSKMHEVSSTVLGSFNNSGFLDIFYNENLVAKLDLDFLHNGLPKMRLKAKWQGPLSLDKWKTDFPDFRKERKLNIDTEKVSDIESSLEKVLNTANVCSKESIVRQYDHEVLGQTAVKPYEGNSGQIPHNAGVLWLGRHSKNKKLCVATGNGMAPRMSKDDPYLMAQMAVDEAVRNMLCQGGDPEHMALLDNFCWPDPIESPKNPDGSEKLAALVRACAGMKKACNTYGLPLVSGKDSMKNDYISKEQKGLKISILPTLLISGMSKSNLDYIRPSYFQEEGDEIYLLGGKGSGLKNSELDSLFHLGPEHLAVPEIDLEKNILLYKKIFKLLKRGFLNSCHDISEGGLATALFESSMSLGCSLEVQESNLIEFLYNEAPGRFIVSIAKEQRSAFEKDLQGMEYLHLGRVIAESKINLAHPKNNISWDVTKLKESYQRELLC